MKRGSVGILLLLVLMLFSSTGCAKKYHTFADHPGFEEYYRDRCASPPPDPTAHERGLLEKFRPRFILPPGGAYPIDFYRDYTPYTTLRTWPGRKMAAAEVNRGLLLKHRLSRQVYLDFDTARYRAEGMDLRWDGKNSPPPPREPVVYGRLYRERVYFPDGKGGTEEHDLTFLKYNILFATSGLPAELSFGSRFLVGLGGFDTEDWHALDNFVAAHVVLDEAENPIALVLAQHNHHRAYLLGKDLPLPEDGRLFLDIALRSNEVYPASDDPVPVRHRVIRWSLYLEYLLSGENPPFLKGFDVTCGRKAGGREFPYELKILSPCDPLYTSEMLLGPPRPFWGVYIGRDGPPGSDYYSPPELLPMGNLLKFAYLHDGDPRDIALVRQTVHRKRRKMDIQKIVEYGGRRFLEDWKGMAKGIENEELRIEN